MDLHHQQQRPASRPGLAGGARGNGEDHHHHHAASGNGSGSMLSLSSSGSGLPPTSPTYGKTEEQIRTARIRATVIHMQKTGMELKLYDLPPPPIKPTKS